ncbi:hypothetical protein KKE26_09880 [bacterium]|nr:hypothetical protein [bacterium]
MTNLLHHAVGSEEFSARLIRHENRDMPRHQGRPWKQEGNIFICYSLLGIELLKLFRDCFFSRLQLIVAPLEMTEEMEEVEELY